MALPGRGSGTQDEAMTISSTSPSGDEPALMRAMRQDTFGGPEVLHESQVPRPEPGISQILIRVRAAGVNPTDWKHRSARRFLGEPPYTLGWDVSGTVEQVGLGVTLFKPGDEVFGMLPYAHGAGSHAEFVVGPTRAFVAISIPPAPSFVKSMPIIMPRPRTSLITWGNSLAIASIPSLK